MHIIYSDMHTASKFVKYNICLQAGPGGDKIESMEPFFYQP